MVKFPFYRFIDATDRIATRFGILKPASWKQLDDIDNVCLYAGRLSRGQPQYKSHFGITPFAPSSRNIPHDLTRPFPIPSNFVEKFQASDVFEHISYDLLPPIFEEIFRVLKPNGLFRFSVPDYRNEIYRSRSLIGEDGDILFDPGGGGRYENGEVVGGGHVWFPTIELVRPLFENSSFSSNGKISYLHYIDEFNRSFVDEIDYRLGFIARTPDHDKRAENDKRALSIVVDAIKL